MKYRIEKDSKGNYYITYKWLFSKYYLTEQQWVWVMTGIPFWTENIANASIYSSMELAEAALKERVLTDKGKDLVTVKEFNV